MKTPERRQRRRSGVFIVNFEQISHILMYPHCLHAGWYIKKKYIHFFRNTCINENENSIFG